MAMEELSSKKNTDCVYFLASPLTCKKGIQCEFRHSEIARLNPRDCWYWLSGNCLNLDCPFRHPPLDTAEEETPEPTTTKDIPCYFYSQGYCAKGDKCGFMHGYSRTTGNQAVAPQPTVTTTSAPPPALVQNTQKPTVAHPTAVETRLVQNELWNDVQIMVPEEEKHVEGSIELEQQENPILKLEELQRRLRQQQQQQEWNLSTGFKLLGPEPDMCDEEQLVSHHVHRAGEYDPAAPYDVSSRLFDPPYEPAVPYDCRISARGFGDEYRRMETAGSSDFETVFMPHNLGMNRRRLEDRLVFPKNRGLLSNRVKHLNGNGTGDFQHETLCGRAVRARTRRMANGSVHSRLGSGRPSIKSRLRFVGNARQQQQHRHSRNTRYLGVFQHWRPHPKVTKRQAGKKQSVPPRMNTRESQFDGPKSLAELKAAKYSTNVEI